MQIHIKDTYFKNALKPPTFLLIILFSSFFLMTFVLFNDNKSLISNNFTADNIKTASGTDLLFQGDELALNITDYGNLYKYNKEVQINNRQEVNLSYYLDDTHEWKASQINISVNSIEDKRNWVNNSGFSMPTIYRVYRESETNHPYNSPRNPSSIWDTIVETHNATYMRAHFTQIGFERYYDYLYILDSGDQNHLITDVDNSTTKYDVYSPWIPGNTIKLTYRADNVDDFYGYHMDYYEYVNESSNYEINSNTWGFNYVENGVSGTNVYGSGECGNATAMYVGLYGEYGDYYQFDYTEGAFSEIYQNITIPRGNVKDAYISFDYNVPFGLKSNDNYIYFKINNNKVYSKGMGDVIEAGKNTWHSTGKIYMDLWANTSLVFSDFVNEQELNISVGIMSGSSVTLTYFEEAYQNIVWFDNISLVLIASANSTQSDIDLKVNGLNLNDLEWGKSNKTLIDSWETNPIWLNFSTVSPYLTFTLETKINGYHETHSKLGQTSDEGILYEILQNGTIFWEFSHNFYMPAQYTDFKFIINKPLSWNFISVLDPTYQTRPFEFGDEGENFLLINKENALFPGFWTFRATSPNYLNLNNTQMIKDGKWGYNEFTTGESTRIRTNINGSGEIPPNVEFTTTNLKIYDPEGNIWYEEDQNPLTNGSVFFSEINFDAFNTTGGVYNYTIFWSNGTALGGIKSNFLIRHNSRLQILKPDDPSGFVGDIFPLRVLLEDSENNLSISDSNISYNWTDGTRYIEEAAQGIYETTLDSADLASKGVYYIVISSLKTGFFDTNVTLVLNLGEETRLQRLQSEYDIELHANSTLKFKFADFDGDGIDGATVDIGISNESLYSVNNTGDGIYYIEFSTLYIDSIGTYELSINFSAPTYQPQYHRFQFEITKQSVHLNVLINSAPISENSLHPASFYDDINVSSQIISQIEGSLISGGKLSWIIGNYEQNITEKSNFWYNGSISCSPQHFNLGINYVYLKFEHENYKNQTFGFQILVNQIELNIVPIDFVDTIKIDIGGTLIFQIRILEPQTSTFIENATVSYSWEYGVGYLEETNPGIYELTLNPPENLEGTFKFNLFVTQESVIYKPTQFSFFLVIGEPSFPTFIIWIIIISLVIGIGVLGSLSLRSYVILPRKRKKQSDLLSRTQKYKDMENIQAIVLIHKLSGIPLFSRSYSILEKQKKELFSGFIQAITTIGEEIIGRKTQEEDQDENLSKSESVERIIELDFKYFYCLICDRGDLRIVLILKDKASERIKEQTANLSLGLMLQISEQIENWDGSLDKFEHLIPPIMNNYLELYYKEPFILNNTEYIADIRSHTDMSKMEIRILNVIYSIAKSKKKFYLDQLLELVHEEDKNKIIDGLETLLDKKIIIPSKN